MELFVFVLFLLLLFFLSLFLMSYNRGATDIQSRVSYFHGESNLRCPKTDRLMTKPWESLWTPTNSFNFPTFLFHGGIGGVCIVSKKCSGAKKKTSTKQPKHKERLLRRLSLIQNFLCFLALVIHRRQIKSWINLRTNFNHKTFPQAAKHCSSSFLPPWALSFLSSQR